MQIAFKAGEYFLHMGGMPAGDPGKSVHETTERLLGHYSHLERCAGSLLFGFKPPDPISGMIALKVAESNLLHRCNGSNFPARPYAGEGSKRDSVADPCSALGRPLRGLYAGMKLSGPPQRIVLKAQDRLVHERCGAGNELAVVGVYDGHWIQGWMTPYPSDQLSMEKFSDSGANITRAGPPSVRVLWPWPVTSAAINASPVFHCRT